MNKFVGFALVCAFILFGCDTATNPATDDTQPSVKIYALGEIGPSGGTIFYTDSTGAYREVSAVLCDNVTWTEAKNQAEDYIGGGNTDWYLPSPAELNQLYKSGTIAKEGTFWSSEEWAYWTGRENNLAVKPAVFDEAWVYNLSDGTRSHHSKSASTYTVRAVRSYNPKAYSVGDTGPGGGKIFWVSDDKKSYKEASGNLGNHNWYEASGSADANHNPNGATSIASNYNGGSCNDWYLPDAVELNELFTNKGNAGIIETNILWSSSEYSDSVAWLQGFSYGAQGSGSKKNLHGVCAIRSFNTAAP